MAVFIGGDTQELEFDFSTKVAGSMIECPLRIYNNIHPDIKPPTPISEWDRWFETRQSDIDKLKTQDNSSIYFSETGDKKIAKFMVEVDLNSLCNNVYGGSHEALKSAMKQLDINAWASGSGNHNENIGYECTIGHWHIGNNKWSQFDDLVGTDAKDKKITNSIKKIGYINNNYGYLKNILTTDNKIYILIASGYPSSATIPSTLNLDYINVKLTLARTPDKLIFTDSEGNKKGYLDVNLGDEWSLLLKGVSPSFNSNEISSFDKVKHILDLNDGSSKNRLFALFTKNYPDKIVCQQYIDNHFQASGSPIINFNKFQCLNLLIQSKDKKIIIYLLKNNGDLIKKAFFYHGTLNNLNRLYIGDSIINTNQLDSFLERFNFFDYAIANTDNEAEVILKGRNELDVNNSRLNELGKQFENPNLCPDFNDKRWSINEHATVSEDGKTLTLNATAHFQSSYITLPVLPNNKYRLTFQKDNRRGYATIWQKYNNVIIENMDGIGLREDIKNVVFDFITKDNINNIYISIQNHESSDGTYKFSNLELIRLD